MDCSVNSISIEGKTRKYWSVKFNKGHQSATISAISFLKSFLKTNQVCLLSTSILPVCLWGSSLAFKGHCLQPDSSGAIPHLPQPQRTLFCSQRHVHPYPTAPSDHRGQVLRQCRLFQTLPAGQCWLRLRGLKHLLVVGLKAWKYEHVEGKRNNIYIQNNSSFFSHFG